LSKKYNVSGGTGGQGGQPSNPKADEVNHVDGSKDKLDHWVI